MVHHQSIHAVEEKACSICLDNINKNDGSGVVTQCKHVFHKDCLKQGIEIHHDSFPYKDTYPCPECRREMTFDHEHNPRNTEEYTNNQQPRLIANNTEISESRSSSDNNSETSTESDVHAQACSICFDDIDENDDSHITTPCNHIFHRECFNQDACMRGRNGRLPCAICRTPINIGNVTRNRNNNAQNRIDNQRQRELIQRQTHRKMIINGVILGGALIYISRNVIKNTYYKCKSGIQYIYHRYIAQKPKKKIEPKSHKTMNDDKKNENASTNQHKDTITS
jgi:hypothetical protein